MKQYDIKYQFLLLICVISIQTYAYDIAVENENGVKIYYNYINDGRELEVTAFSFDSWDKDGNSSSSIKYDHNSARGYKGVDTLKIPSEVNYMNRTRKVTAIGDYAFANSRISVAKYSKPVGRDENDISVMYIPQTINRIGKCAFYYESEYYGDPCCTVKKIVVEDIGKWCEMDIGLNNYGFLLYTDDNTPVTNLIIPEGVQSIRENTFLNCSSLISVHMPNTVKTIGDNAFRNCKKITQVDIGEKVERIGRYAFSECSMEMLSIPNSVIEIEAQAFKNCKLSSINWGSGLKTIGYEAFMGCINLKTINLPEGLESIGYGAFGYISQLTTITIPKSVTNIERRAFWGWGDEQLATIFLKVEKPFKINEDVFSKNTLYNATLYVPKGTKDKYLATDGWKEFLFIEEGDYGGDDDIPTTQKCERPTISYNNGILMFDSETKGVSFQSTITDTDIKTYNSREVQLDVTYNINVYATKAGYEDSEIVTATLCWIDADPKTEGITNSVANVRAKAVLIQSNGNVLSVSGVDEGTEINVYDTAGKKVGSQIATSDITNIATSLDSGSIGIIKIGEKAVKVLIK